MENRSRRPMDRREFIKMAGVAGIALVGAACAPAAVSPTAVPTKAATTSSGAAPASTPVAALKPEEVRAQLYEAAKKEGHFMAYTTGTSKEFDLYRQAFSKTYPGIDIQDWDGTNEQILEKMGTEFRANKVNADFVMFPVDSWYEAKKQGIVQAWTPPESVNFPAGAVDADHMYVLDNGAVHVISYNTQLVPADKAPKSYQDLLDPVFKGKLGLEQNANSWFAQRIAIWGKDKTLAYCKQLAAQDLKFISGHTTLADAVVSGEIWAAVNVYQHRVVQQIAKGAPVKWVADQPTGVEPNGIGLAANAPHPNAGKLFIDWRLSEEGAQVTFKGLDRYPFRNGASLPPDMQVKITFPSAQTTDQTQEMMQLFKQTFGLI